MPTEEDIEILSRKLSQLRLGYEQYFLGNRPREPILLRDEVQKLVVVYSNEAIQNTALRFKFNSILSRYQAFKRQWTETLRKMENGTYTRHRFKAGLHAGDAPHEQEGGDARERQDRREVYDAYVEARRACGEPVENLTPKKLEALLDRQESSIREKYGEADVRFKVVVEDGKAKLKASRG